MEQLEVKQSNMIIQLLEEKNVLNDKINKLELINDKLENKLKMIIQQIEKEKENNSTHWRNIYLLSNSEGKEKFESISNFKSEKNFTIGKDRGLSSSIEIVKEIINKK